VSAFEIEGGEAGKARSAIAADKRVRAAVTEGDFLEWALTRIDSPPEFDCVVGNPPFIRYQYLDHRLQENAEKLIRGLNLRFTKHTNAWVPFVVACLNRLKPGGRLAMVVPAELLHVLHADSARTLLLRECSRILVLDPEEIWFEDTLQGVVLLLAEKRAATTPSWGLGAVKITRLKGRALLSEDPSEHFSQGSFISGEHLPAKWMLALLSDRERSALIDVAENKNVRRFSQAASAVVGIVTGANGFFLVPDAVVDGYNLHPFAHPMFGRSEHVAGVIYDAASHDENRRRGLPTNFLWFDEVPRSDLPSGALRYVKSGESQKLHLRFKCRTRDPWYTVPSVFAAPVGMLKRSHEYPRLVLNRIGAFTTDTAYRIVPKPGVSAERLVCSFVNSLTALCCELEGRHYGGGVLELIPSEIRRLLVPLPQGLGASDLRTLDQSFRSGLDAASVLEAQDRKILGGVGLSQRAQSDLQHAWWRLRSRRHRSGADVDSKQVEPNMERERDA
jgi:adenine-specific DNA methylase